MKHPTFARLGRLAAGAYLCSLLAGDVEAQAVLKPPVINGTNVTLEWSSRIPVGALQIAPAADGPWTTIADASVFVSNRVVTPLGLPARFFRVFHERIVFFLGCWLSFVMCRVSRLVIDLSVRGSSLRFGCQDNGVPASSVYANGRTFLAKNSGK